MNDDILNISFDDIVKYSEQVEDTDSERILEINSYEKLYLLKPDENGKPSMFMGEKEKLSLYENIVFSGLRRYYVEDLTQRDFLLEGSTPYQIELCGMVLQDNSWGNFLCKVALLLLDKFPEKKEQVLDFRTQWTKTAMFTTVKKTNAKPLNENLYLNCNHTALHSCWLLQDLLDFFNIEKSSVKFLIHRPSSIEPVPVREHIEKLFVMGFKEYLKRVRDYDEEKCEKTVGVIYKYLNPALCTISKSYTNLFLFDDTATLANYVKKIKDNIEGSVKFDPKAKKVLNKYLNFLWDYYKA